MVTISFQGELGAYSHQACVEAVPGCDVIPCPSFESAIDAVHDGRADMAMLAVENSTHGRVADVHQLLPEANLYAVAEHFVRVHINLMGLKGSRIEDVKIARSHPVLLGQCRDFLRAHGILPERGVDTAGSAREIAERGDPAAAALGSKLAGELYGLDLLAEEIEDRDSNTTRFLLMGPEEATPPEGAPVITSFLFRVRNIPAALYKGLGGFATNGVNMIKLESYIVDDSFEAAEFYAEIIGRPTDAHVERAMDELRFFTSMVRMLGSYAMHPMRPHMQNRG
ncbi:prephenate dehydratase [Paracoccaceae bacterium GXU_MW_L88]